MTITMSEVWGIVECGVRGKGSDGLVMSVVSRSFV